MISLGLLTIGVLFLIAGCGSSKKAATKDAKTWQDIKEKGTIVVGLDDTFVPMGFRDENDKLVGFDIDLATAVFKEAGIKVKFQPIDWSMKETELKNGSIDAIWNGYTVTNDRKKQVTFSNPYLTNEQAIVSLKKDNIKKVSDLKDQALGAQEGSSGAESLENEPEKLNDLIKDQDAVLYGSFAESFIDLNAGRIKGILIDRVYAEYYISHEKNSSDYSIIEGPFGKEKFAVGVRKGDTATAKVINKGLKKLYDSGEAQKISEKWFGSDKILPQK